MLIYLEIYLRKKMSKIIVEDRTKLKEEIEEDVVSILAGQLFVGAANAGTLLGMKIEDIALSLLVAADDIMRYLSLVEDVNDEEIQSIKDKAVKENEKREKELKDSGAVGKIKEILSTLKINKDNNK